MSEIVRQQEELIALLEANGTSLVGFGDLSDIDTRITHGFTTAISTADVCPSKALKNMGWQVGVGRNELINVYDCNEYRLSFEPAMGRKHSCGLCVKACRVGLEKER